MERPRQILGSSKSQGLDHGELRVALLRGIAGFDEICQLKTGGLCVPLLLGDVLKF